MENVKLKTSYMVHEYEVIIKDIGACILLASIVKDDGKDLLEVSLKANERSRLVYFVVGYYIEDSSEIGIKSEVKKLVDNEYFNTFLLDALEDEGEQNWNSDF